jgi:pimeloyl-ACP methyl ester carboxylesterase
MIDWADVNGVSLRYDLTGGGDRVLVLLHEMGGTLETWDAVLPMLGGFRVLRYDMRGAGLSQKVDAIAFDDLVEDLRQLLDALGLSRPAALAGIAVSAAVAVGFAARYPERCGRLFLMSLATGIPPERRAAALALAAAIKAEGPRARVEQRLDATFPARFRTDAARLRAFRGRGMANDPESYAACYAMLAGLDLVPLMRRVRCPALVLAGTEDRTRPPEMVERDAAAIPGMRFEAVDSGHVMPALTPDLVAARLKGFLATP